MGDHQHRKQPRPTGPPWRAVAVAAVVLALVAGACSSGSSSSNGGAAATTTAAPANSVGALRALHAIRGTNARILDDQGGQVLLRGVNVNSLGDYFQANPAYTTTLAVTDADWAAMAAHGFDVVRLLISWSRLEPTRATSIRPT